MRGPVLLSDLAALLLLAREAGGFVVLCIKVGVEGVGREACQVPRDLVSK